MQHEKENFYLNLKNKIDKNKLKIGVVGLGYVGLNLLCLFSKKFKCICLREALKELTL